MSPRSHRSGPKPPSLVVNLVVLAALLGFLALTVGTAYINMGPANVVANVGIAVAKAILVLTFYMRLKSDSPLFRIVAVSGFAWLAVLIALSLADLLTRPA
ncbi:MAG TPA: cytochrome C oxidase subunit IV family protein [Steroidobacteraceae bacterium]|nr:cytochrome C oxidase subunit IV family protein [Steroidobacteraceae bacterium]